MKRTFALVLVILISAFVAGSDAFAQAVQGPQLPILRIPRVSQGARVTQVIGLSEVTIQYHRPGVKGRQIWGGLLPYDSIWRAGANEPTLFTFSDEVTIDGKKLPAGTYRFLTLPGKQEWTAIFNSETKNWGTVYEPNYDVLKFSMKPEEGPFTEWLTFDFTDLTPSSARVVLAWEKVRVGFKIEFNTAGKIASSLGNWQVFNQAARYAITEKVFNTDALGWIDRSIGIDKNPTNLGTKAELLAMGGKTKDAIVTAQEALTLGKSKDPKFEGSRQGQALSKLLAEWKAKPVQ